MDENEREIARIMAEEANAIDASKFQNDMNEPNRPVNANDNAGFPVDDHANDGVRAPDQQRVQVLAGEPEPYNHYDEFDERYNHH